jgi:hypothetical protein
MLYDLLFYYVNVLKFHDCKINDNYHRDKKEKPKREQKRRFRIFLLILPLLFTLLLYKKPLSCLTIQIPINILNPSAIIKRTSLILMNRALKPL